MHPNTDTPSGVVVIKSVGLGEETFDVEVEYDDHGTFETVTETNVVQAATSGGALLLYPNGGGPARIYSPSGYTHAKVVRRAVLGGEA